MFRPLNRPSSGCTELGDQSTFKEKLIGSKLILYSEILGAFCESHAEHAHTLFE